MRTIEESRKYEVLMSDGSWQPVHWEQLDEGDVVRIVPREDVVDPFLSQCNPFVIAEMPGLKVDPWNMGE